MGSDKSVMTRTMRSFVHEKEQRLRPVPHLLKPLLVHAGQSRSRLTCSSPPSSPPSLSSSLASSSASSPASNSVVHSLVGRQPCCRRHVTSSSRSSETYPGLCSFGKVSKDGVPKAKVSKFLKCKRLIDIPGGQHQL